MPLRCRHAPTGMEKYGFIYIHLKNRSISTIILWYELVYSSKELQNRILCEGIPIRNLGKLVKIPYIAAVWFSHCHSLSLLTVPLNSKESRKTVLWARKTIYSVWFIFDLY